MRRAAAALSVLLLAAGCGLGDPPERRADPRCDPGGERAALLDTEPSLLAAPEGQRIVERVVVDATYDDLKTYDCNEQLLFLDLAPAGEPTPALELLRGHLVDGGWTVEVVSPVVPAMTATKQLAPGLTATLRANVLVDEGVVRVAAALPPAVVDPD